MADVLPSSRRPVCPSCSKPARICLCSRFRSPSLENSVGIIILQHSSEKNHPLNSARIAKLGLKNVDIATVSDVNFEAHFTIRLPEPNSAAQNLDPDAECSFRNGHNATQKSQIQDESIVDKLNSTKANKGAAISATIGKYGVVNSFDHIWMQQPGFQELKINEVLASPEIRASLAKGFIVKKLQKRKLVESKGLEEYAEFEIQVPPKSVLLFPSENAFTVSGGVDGSDFYINHLIVLDGTWAKAKRMYNENPWLRLLPHMKLDLEMMSLYSEVRHQPKIGFLSTIESIVYALKLIGDHPEGLDDLLDVFESMIGDQRKCKDERLKITCQR
ncbi:DTW domain-containing protein 2 [Cucumis melo var. makuwa]|nr:DTW domain-containing protein 2 [Cucumis melo var. makuwa]TYJ95885.1 DTW domain-containing protein 2 [Cucumis melo var. makuwa]